jgi:rhodanese-related sulfurtransferase
MESCLAFRTKIDLNNIMTSCISLFRPAFAVMILSLLAAVACGGTDEEPDAGDTELDTIPDEPAEVTPDDVPHDPLQDRQDTDDEDAAADVFDVSPDVEPDGVDEPWPDDRYITMDEVHRRFTAGDPDMLLLNVVDEEFYDLGHIPGSLVIPWDLLADHLDLVDSARHVVIYCRRGVRSEPAYVTLHDDAGYPLVWIMEGGLEPWIAAGYPTAACGDVSVTCL